jgi:hypothetical protein
MILRFYIDGNNFIEKANRMEDNIKELQIGNIYKYPNDDRPNRIICFDNFEVFYDCYWDDDIKWIFADHTKRKCYYYRTSAKTFKTKWKFIEERSLTIEEKKIYRPDLPMRFGRIPGINWSDFNIEMYNGTEEIYANKIILVPHGKKGGLRKGKILESSSSKILIKDILFEAKVIQCDEHPESDGIGLFRLGSEKMIPTYYIGEYLDQVTQMS